MLRFLLRPVLFRCLHNFKSATLDYYGVRFNPSMGPLAVCIHLVSSKMVVVSIKKSQLCIPSETIETHSRCSTPEESATKHEAPTHSQWAALNMVNPYNVAFSRILGWYVAYESEDSMKRFALFRFQTKCPKFGKKKAQCRLYSGHARQNT